MNHFPREYTRKNNIFEKLKWSVRFGMSLVYVQEDKYSKAETQFTLSRAKGRTPMQQRQKTNPKNSRDGRHNEPPFQT